MPDVSNLWKAAVLRGVLAMAVGAALVAWPKLAFGLAVILFGAYSIAVGLVDGGAVLLRRVETDQRGLLLVLAILNIVVGLLLVLAPQRTTSFVLVIAGIGIAIDGAARLVRYVRYAPPGWTKWVFVAVAVVELFIAAMFIFNPLVTGVGFVAVLGAVLLTYGVVGVAAGLAAKASSSAGGGPMTPA